MDNDDVRTGVAGLDEVLMGGVRRHNNILVEGPPGAGKTTLGLAFIHAGGTLYERTLGPGELLRVDTGCIVGFQPTIDYDIQFVGGIKTALFGGEGLFFATLRGPGKIWL